MNTEAIIAYDTTYLWSDHAKRNCELQLFTVHWQFGEFSPQKDQSLIRERSWYNIIGDKLWIDTWRYNYHEAITKCDVDAYVVWFRQSYEYFHHIRDLLLHDIVPEQAMDEKNQSLIDIFKNENAIAVHIRRWDFQTVRLSTIHLKGKHRHSIVPLSYYQEAITLIKNKISSPVFYIFSNDIQWCKDIFVWSEFHFVEHNTWKESYKDMILMSQCKHNIICNSTFSWWGAYLNNNKDKIVVTPQKRYDAPLNTKDLLLPDRIAL